MAESANSMTRGTEISERSTELVLPGIDSPEERVPLRGREIGVNGSEASTRGSTENGRPRERERTAAGEFISQAARAASSTTQPSAASPPPRGVALPGDRSSRSHEAPEQRPSFWRRIALGRRGQAEPSSEETPAPRIASSVAVTQSTAVPSAASIEMRIVEPMLQALVSVESKLERSHLDLMGRSDQVEQRLTQLWDIEEQLGTLGEIQESLLTVTEQQRRLERTIESQNRTLRWMVAAIFFSLAAAAFVVAAVLH